MSLERLVAEIESRAQQEIASEQARFEKEQAEILADRTRRIAVIRSETLRRATQDASRERTRRIAGARLAAKKLGYEYQEARTKELLETVKTQLAAYAGSPEYPKLMKRMYAAATSRLGKDVKIRGRAEDAKLLRSIAGNGFEETAVSVTGGFVAETSDGTRRLNLTFDELLRLREDELRSLLPT
ncbi:MAG: V-type ATP synthase subunit E family protein [Thermoplasmata archaeon]